MEEIDLTSEMKELLKAYDESERYLRVQKESSMNTLIYYMKNFINISDEHEKINDKLKKLLNKIVDKKETEEEDEE